MSQFIKPIDEADFKINYINPFLQTFLNNDRNLLKWAEVNPKERSGRSSRKKKIPNAIVYYIMNQLLLGAEIAFGEVKSIESTDKNRSLCLDLYCLLHFSKNVIDSGIG